jgi:hypothetical protein
MVQENRRERAAGWLFHPARLSSFLPASAYPSPLVSTRSKNKDVTADCGLVLIRPPEYFMGDEAAARSSGASDGGGHPRGGDGISSPLQARAKFLKNWSWDAVVSINRGACERGRAQQGINSETHGSCAQEWEKARDCELSLAEAFHLLRSFHRKAPFLFFNGNTFSTIGRELTFAIFSDLPSTRKREVGSAVGHYIGGCSTGTLPPKSSNHFAKPPTSYLVIASKRFAVPATAQLFACLKTGASSGVRTGVHRS